MFSKRSFFSTVGLGAIVALTSWFAVQSSDRGIPVQPKTIVANGVAHKVHMLQYAANGLLSYQGTAAKVTQYSDQTIVMDQVQGTYYTAAPNPPWTGRADHATISDNNTVIDLTGNVLLSRPAQGTARALQLATSQLFLYPKSNSAYTAQPVTLSEPGSLNVTHAVGLRAHENPDVIELLSNIQSTYEPPKSTSTPTVSIQSAS